MSEDNGKEEKGVYLEGVAVRSNAVSDRDPVRGGHGSS
jgi:hypothetical protein